MRMHWKEQPGCFDQHNRLTMMHKRIYQAGGIIGRFDGGPGRICGTQAQAIIFCGRNDDFETGVKYQFYHVLALFLSGILYREFSSSLILWAGRLFITGMMLFSGSLYLLAWLKSAGMESLLWVGAITPLGGTAFIAGWICLFIAAGKKLIPGIQKSLIVAHRGSK